MLRGRCSPVEARSHYANLLALGVYIVEATPARRSAALDLALGHGIAYYDALYVQLSRETGLPLLTADYPLYERIQTDFPDTAYLGALPR